MVIFWPMPYTKTAMNDSDRDVLLSFLHSAWPADERGTPERLGAWLTDHGLLEQDVTVSQSDLRDTSRLHSALMALFAAHSAGDLGEEAKAQLRVVAQGLPLCVTMEGRDALRLQPAGQGFSAALAKLLAIAYEAHADSELSRFKICQNCGHAFYDKSKNRSAIWCTMAKCGSQNKSRAYRARKRVPAS